MILEQANTDTTSCSFTIPPNIFECISVAVELFQFLAKSVEDDLSLDELEKYAKIRNMTRSPLVTKDPNM